MEDEAVRPTTNPFVELSQSEPIMKYFSYAHLPSHLQPVSKAIGDVALDMCGKIPRSAERAAGLRKLLEAKDCLVRAAMP